jgi:hypothetical protein
LLCRGCLYTVRGAEPSFIGASRLAIDSEFYKQLEEKDCGSYDAKWGYKTCRPVAESFFFTIGKTCEHFTRYYTVHCKEQGHEYRNLGFISIAGPAELEVREVKADAGRMFVKSLKWLSTPKQELISRQIVKRTWCTGTPPAHCTATTKEIETLSAGIIVGSMSGTLESIEIDNGRALVPAGYFKRDLNVIKLGSWSPDASSPSGLWFSSMPQATLTAMLNTALQTYVPAVRFAGFGPLVPYALGAALVQTCQEGSDQQQLDCLQHEFLRNLVAEYSQSVHRNVFSAPFSFVELEQLVHTAIYEQPDFYTVPIIFRYGSSRSMVMEFLQNALRAGPQIGAVPGLALTDSQKRRLDEPIIWPVWIQDAEGNTVGVSFEFYIPPEYILLDVLTFK